MPDLPTREARQHVVHPGRPANLVACRRQRAAPLSEHCVRAESEKGVCFLKIYVGNLSFETTDDDLNREFSVYGEVASSNVVNDRDTGRSRGFGFVDMPSEAEAKAAIAGLNGKDIMGRTLTVNESRPREGGTGGGYGGNRGGSGGGYGGGSRRY